MALIGLLSVAEDYDFCYSNTQQKVQKRGFEPSVFLEGDVVFDIHVYGGTYARLHCWGREFDMVKENDIFTFPDITIDKPLTTPFGYGLRISTDGEQVTWSCGIYAVDIFVILNSLFNR